MTRRSRPAATPAESQAAGKHLLETSLLYPLQFGSEGFKQRINAALGEGKRYTTHYVRIEFRRVALLRVAQFCLQLLLPSVRTADELLADWANHFGDRDAKFIVALCRYLIPQGIDTTSPAAKPTVFRCLAEYALLLEVDVSEGTTAPPDAGPRCHRAAPHLLTKATHPDAIAEALRDFVEAFQDVEHCRANCRIDHFLTRHRPLVDRWITEADGVRGDARDAMRKLAPKAQGALRKGLDAWTCRDCAALGDWIVTLDCPGFLQVEHLDHVYDYLCPTRGLAHRKHRPDRI
jgi:AcrR family transcriptional regulator